MEWHLLPVDNFSTMELIARIHHFLKYILKYLHYFHDAFQMSIIGIHVFQKRWHGIQMGVFQGQSA